MAVTSKANSSRGGGAEGGGTLYREGVNKGGQALDVTHSNVGYSTRFV